MSFMDPTHNQTPRGWRKIFYVNWPLVLLITAVACFGFLMLYSVAGGDISRWAQPQITRFSVGMIVMFIVAFTPLTFWRSVSLLAYVGELALLLFVLFFGSVGMGAQRWIDLGFFQLQPSELMKIALVMALALYYDWLPPEKVSHFGFVLIPLAMIGLPAMMVVVQPDLGTAILLVASGGVVMFLAGVSYWYFIAAFSAGVGAITAVFMSRGASWQLLNNYQYKRIDTFLDPSLDPLGAGYHITQSKIALGSGGLSGRGFMQGPQSQLNFLPEKQTDFIFTTLAEEFGYVGTTFLLILYSLIMIFAISAAIKNKNRFGALLIGGVAATFFFYFALNMSMVMGLAPVVGVPLPLVSYGGSAMLVLLGGFGLIQSAHIHRPK
ncbi:MAG TPA: rod shape-determining protein RodA [Rhodobacteraceae bacterium]|nr:rod shape-determining protein RodA [Paracoccaceae bacterium]